MLFYYFISEWVMFIYEARTESVCVCWYLSSVLVHNLIPHHISNIDWFQQSFETFDVMSSLEQVFCTNLSVFGCIHALCTDGITSLIKCTFSPGLAFGATQNIIYTVHEL